MSVLTDLRNRASRTCSSSSATGLRACRGRRERLAAGDRADLHRAPDRNTFHLASKRDWDALKRDVKPIYTA